MEMLYMADATTDGATQNRDMFLLVTLDVYNAFNIAPWPLIDEAIRTKGVPPYMTTFLRSYMSRRRILVNRVKPMEVRFGLGAGHVESFLSFSFLNLSNF